MGDRADQIERVRKITELTLLTLDTSHSSLLGVFPRFSLRMAHCMPAYGRVLHTKSFCGTNWRQAIRQVPGDLQIRKDQACAPSGDGVESRRGDHRPGSW